MQRRLVLAAILFVLIMSTIQLNHRVVSVVQADTPAAKTHVCGQITADTTWTQANSPYQMDCTVVVPAGKTLVIAQGVSVYAAAGVTLQVGGKLIANGSAQARVVFAWTGTSDTNATGVGFVAGADSGSSISYADFSGATYAALQNYPGILLDNVTFHDNPNIALDISLANNSGGSGQTLSIQHCTFIRNAIAISAEIGNGSLSIQDSVVTQGTRDDLSSITLRAVQADNVHINSNNISGNAGWNLEPSPPAGSSTLTIDATSNWWGTTDPQSIQAKLHDCNADLTKACANFRPFLTAPVTGAGATAPPPPTPTQTPGPGGTVTRTPTPTSTPKPTSTPSPKPTRTATEVPTAAPSPTATTIPTATSTATPTATASPASEGVTFRVLQAKVGYGSSSPGRVVKRPSLGKVHVGQKVKLFLFASIEGVASPLPVILGFRVTTNGTTIWLHKWSRTVPESPPSVSSWYTFYTPKKAGRFVFSGTLFVGPYHQHKMVTFTVVP